MKARLIATAVLAATIIAGTAGCNMIAPQATTKHYDASDGVSANVGDLQIRNILIVTGDDDATLAMSVVNNSTDDTKLTITVDGERTSVLIPASRLTAFGVGAIEGIPLKPFTVPAGATTEIDFQYGDKTAATAEAPVLDGLLPEYEHLVPEGTTPTPRATAEHKSSGH